METVFNLTTPNVKRWMLMASAILHQMFEFEEISTSDRDIPWGNQISIVFSLTPYLCWAQGTPVKTQSSSQFLSNNISTYGIEIPLLALSYFSCWKKLCWVWLQIRIIRVFQYQFFYYLFYMPSLKVLEWAVLLHAWEKPITTFFHQGH